MNDGQRIAEHVAALTVGWSEHVEYAVRIPAHTVGCARKSCLCPDGDVEARAKTVRYPALLAQLQQSISIPSSGGPPSVGGSNPNKSGSRPPGNIAPLILIDTISEEARHHYADLWSITKGTPPALSTVRKTVEVLRNLATLAEVSHEHPVVVHDVAVAASTWVRKAKIMLGYQRPQVMMESTTCHACGGALAVAADASTDVRCVGSPGVLACGQVYRRADWIGLLLAARE